MKPNDKPADMEPAHTVDFRRIEFPSDALTIRRIREMEPQVDKEGDFDFTNRHNDHENQDSRQVASVKYVLVWEREVASLAYDLTIGSGPTLDSWKKNGVSPKEIDDALAVAYLRYGLADTTTAAKKLISSVRQQAEAQAFEALGKGAPSSRKR